MSSDHSQKRFCLTAEQRIRGFSALSGTPLYFAPEVLSIMLTNDSLPAQKALKLAAAPLATWCIGACVYELLTLRPYPFTKPGDEVDPAMPLELLKEMWETFHMLVSVAWWPSTRWKHCILVDCCLRLPARLSMFAEGRYRYDHASALPVWLFGL